MVVISTFALESRESVIVGQTISGLIGCGDCGRVEIGSTGQLSQWLAGGESDSLSDGLPSTPGHTPLMIIYVFIAVLLRDSSIGFVYTSQEIRGIIMITLGVLGTRECREYRPQNK